MVSRGRQRETGGHMSLFTGGSQTLGHPGYSLGAFIYRLLDQVNIFDPRVWLNWVIGPKTTKIGYKLLSVGPFG